MPSLRELQAQFAATLLGGATPPSERMAIYRNTVSTNYRNALDATYPVVRQLVGAPFFKAAVDAYVLEHPSTGGDLNVYGDRFGDFLAAYPYAKELPYLPDAARLEWAIDEAHRAADCEGTPDEVLAQLAAIPGDKVSRQRFAFDPSCRFIASDYPVLRIWQAHQAGFMGDTAVEFGMGTDRLLIRREAGAVVVERLSAAAFAWLHALAAHADLATALETAISADATFDLGTALREGIANRTIAGLAVD
jgi:hypothetical protein